MTITPEMRRLAEELLNEVNSRNDYNVPCVFQRSEDLASLILSPQEAKVEEAADQSYIERELTLDHLKTIRACVETYLSENTARGLQDGLNRIEQYIKATTQLHHEAKEEEAGGEVDVEIAKDLAKSDDEIWMEAVREHGSPAAAFKEADRVRSIIQRAVDSCVPVKSPIMLLELPRPSKQPVAVEGNEREAFEKLGAGKWL